MAQKLKTQYQGILAEDTVLSFLSSHSIPIYIVEDKNDTPPTFLELTAFLLERRTKQRGDEALLAPNTLLIAIGVQLYFWMIINKLDVAVTLLKGFHDTAQPHLTDPIKMDGSTDEALVSTHPSMPDLEQITSEDKADISPHNQDCQSGFAVISVQV